MPSLGDRILWRRALDYLKVYRPDAIVVTGSSDKTMTVRAIAHALAPDRTPHATQAPYHPPRRVSLGILGIDHTTPRTWFQALTGSLVHEIANPEPDTLVIGTGLTRPGDIDTLAHHLSPRFTVVTNVQSEHLDLFPNKAAIAHEYSSLPTVTKDHVFLNADDALVTGMAEHLRVPTSTFGRTPGADIRLIRATATPSGGFIGEVAVRGTPYEFHAPWATSEAHLTSLLASLAVATAYKINPATALERLQTFRLPNHHFQRLTGVQHTQLIDDTSATTPERIEASLRTCHTLPAYRRFAIVGDIPDLGSEAHALHRALGQTAATTVDVLIAIGYLMRQAGAAALRAGIDVHHFDTARDASKWIESHLKSRDLILVAGGEPADMRALLKHLRADQSPTA